MRSGTLEYNSARCNLDAIMEQIDHRVWLMEK